MRRLVPLILAGLPTVALAGSPDAEDALFNQPSWPVALRLHAEVGIIAPVAHWIQFGTQGTSFDVIDDLGSDTVFPALRFSADLDVGKRKRNTIVLLYQPLQLNTTGIVQGDAVVDDLTFPAGTPTELQYGFSFWRASWMYDTHPDPDLEVACGLSLQLRNAVIAFRSEDGTLFRERRDVGPVPAVKLRVRGTVAGRFWMGTEIDGFYSQIRGLNGGRTDVEGAILDGSLRFGMAWNRGVDSFLNLRYLGGGAEGTSQDPDFYSDGFTSNWLHTFALTVGVSVR